MMRTLCDINRQYAASLGADRVLVYGEGDSGARLALVGEAPGAREEARRRPFVGSAGKNLDAFLAGVSLRREMLYITNAVKFRPTKQGTSGRLSNRTPTRSEVEAFRPWLLAELDVVRPRIIATLGNTALRAVTGEAFVIGDVHGRPLPWKDGSIIFPLYHPASVIYRRALRSVYEADIEALRDCLREE